MSPADRGNDSHRSAPAWLRIWAILLVSVVAGGLGSIVSVTPAQAEGLVASEPGVRQELEQAPGWVTLAFAAEVDPSVAKVLVTDADGTNVTTGSLIVEGTNVTTQLQEGLEPGTYTVRFRINRPDGQPEGGAYQFAYGAGDFREPPEQAWTGRAQEPKVLNDPDPNAVTPQPSGTAAVPDVEVERQDSSPAPPSSGPGPGEPKSEGSGSPEPTDEPTTVPSSTVTPAPTPSSTPAAPGAGLDMPPWPVWFGLGTFGLFLIIAAVAFLRSRR